MTAMSIRSCRTRHLSLGGCAAIAAAFVAACFAGRARGAGPVHIRVEPTEWNFGVRPQRFLITNVFRIAPPAGAPGAKLAIERVWTSCECFTTQVLRREGAAAAPAELRVVMDTESYKGRFRRSVFVSLDIALDPDGPGRKQDVMLGVAGWVVPSARQGRARVFCRAGTEGSEALIRWRDALDAPPDVRTVTFVDTMSPRGAAQLREEAVRAGVASPGDEVAAFFNGGLVLRGAEDVVAGLTGFLNVKKDGRPKPEASSAREGGAEGRAQAPDATSGYPGFPREAPPPGVLEVHVCYFSRCRGCREGLAAARALRGRLGPKVRVTFTDVDRDRAAVPRVHAAVDLYPDAPVELPSMIAFVGDALVLGPEAMASDLETAARGRLELGGEHLRMRRPASEGAAEGAIPERVELVSVAVVVLAALADGVNPCAFAAMVLLISVLSTVRLAEGAERGTAAGLALGGGAMCLGVFVTYYAAGLALFKGAGVVESYPLVEAVVFWAVWALAAGGFVLSSVDAARYLRTGDAKRVLLRIPEPLRRRLAPLLRTSLGRGGLTLGGFAAGVIIALVEGVCTGQMLLPTIQYMASTPGLRASGALYLLLYNALFTLPLVAILGVAIAGVRFQALSGFLKKHLAAAKLLLAAVFLVLATAMLVGRLV